MSSNERKCLVCHSHSGIRHINGPGPLGEAESMKPTPQPLTDRPCCKCGRTDPYVMIDDDNQQRYCYDCWAQHHPHLAKHPKDDTGQHYFL